ncbi:MAG TPA: phospholipase D-like domain-containing protein [archaeon]|nr:phospholipase D-like domain-containing protein [archaeon]
MNELRLLTILLVFIAFSGCTIGKNAGVEAFFCPQDACEERAVAAIKSAETDVDAAIYSFTSREIETALEEAARKGVRLRVVTDYLQSKSKYSVVNELAGKGIEVRVMPYNRTMHNKFLVVDNKLVITGSYNWTTNSDESNNENLVFIRDTETAQRYSEEFFRLWVGAG